MRKIKGTSKNVIPTKVGIHNPLKELDSGFRRNDEYGVFRGALKLATVCLLVLLSLRASAEVVDRVVAIANGEAITLSDLDHAMASGLGQILKSGNREAAFHSARRQALERLVDEKLMGQAMKKAKIEVEPDELDHALEGFLQQRKMTRPQLEQALRQQGIPFDTFLNRVGDEVRQMKFVQQEVGKRVKISEQEMQDYYRRHMGRFKSSGRGSATGADYERLRDQIQQALYQEKMQSAVEQYVRQLRQKAYVEIKE